MTKIALLVLWTASALIPLDAAQRIDSSLEPLPEQTQALSTDASKKTPLEAAVDAQDSTKVKAILNSGADPNASGDLGIPPLGLAAIHNDLKSAELLVNNGAKVDEPSRFGRRTALFYAQTPEMATFLLQHRANLEARDADQETPLSFASITPNHKLIKLYMEQKANPNVANNRGDTPLKRTAWSGAPEDVEALLLGGADPNFAPDPDHITALNSLMLLNPCPQPKLAENLSLLVKHGAKCDLKDRSGSPLERATANRCEPFVKILTDCIEGQRP
jgi:ankyrin repeat protein